MIYKPVACVERNRFCAMGTPFGTVQVHCRYCTVPTLASRLEFSLKFNAMQRVTGANLINLLPSWVLGCPVFVTIPGPACQN